ncbi:MAG: hypothetical protein JWN99_2027 [Ilumatobacteraceae bacterium]|nr:hypothetical protein [Ilumatobacteraceae bacterium]
MVPIAGVADPAVHAADGSGVVTVANGVPAGATAVLTNLTMVNGSAAGYVTADRCSTLVDGTQQWSNANHGARSAVANLAVVPVDADGQFCLYHQRPVNLLSDIEGWVGPASTDSLRFVPADPVRVLDTRGSAAIAAPLPAGDSVVRVQTGAPGGAKAVLANITMVDATMAGYVTADRCSTLITGPQAWSSGNHLIGAAVANLSVVPIDADGAFCIYRQRPVQLTVDVQGSFAAGPAGSGITVEQPRRVLDTRGTGVTAAALPMGDSIVRVQTDVAPDTQAALVNITMVDAPAAGYITAARCSTLTTGAQSFSNGNFGVGAAVSNLSVVPLDADGSFCIYRQRPVQLTVDVQGSFATTATDELHLVPPTRALDTRPVSTGATSCTSVVHIGDSTSVGLISPKVLTDPADRVDAQYARVGVIDARMEISGARSIVERLPGQANAYEVAQAQIAQGFHGCWVFALGTTDTANVAAGSSVSRRTRIDQMMNLVNGAPVMWVNLRTLETADPWSDVQMQAWNRELELATQRYPNLKIYDWASAAQVQWFGADRIHYTVDGYRQRARLIADALAALYPA